MAENQKNGPSFVTNDPPPLTLTELRGDRFGGFSTEGERGPLAALDDPNNSDKRLSFPSTLQDDDHWVCFRVAKNFKLKRKSVSQSDTLAYIYLPVPTNLQTGYKSNYANEDLGLAGQLAIDSGMLTGTDGNSESYKNAVSALAADVAQSQAAAGFASGLVAQVSGSGTAGTLIAGGAGVAASQAIKAGIASQGITRNPHTAVLFSGVGFRSHSFNYKLIPRNRQESAILNEIITAFKYYMAPQLKKGNHFFDYPEQFDIDFKNERSLFDIGTSVLTSFDVNYHGNGTPLYFQGNDGDMNPTVVDISMTFQEVTITTKEEITKFGR